MLIKFQKTRHVGIFKMARKFLKMALCLRSAHSWRAHSATSSDGLFNCTKQDEHLYNVTSFKLSFWSKFVAHTGDKYKTQRMNSCWKYVQSDKCLIRTRWYGMVRFRLHPALLNKPSHTMISAVACTISDKLLPIRHALTYQDQSFCLFKRVARSQLENHVNALRQT